MDLEDNDNYLAILARFLSALIGENLRLKTVFKDVRSRPRQEKINQGHLYFTRIINSFDFHPRAPQMASTRSTDLVMILTRQREGIWITIHGRIVLLLSLRGCVRPPLLEHLENSATEMGGVSLGDLLYVFQNHGAPGWALGGRTQSKEDRNKKRAKL